MAEAGREMGSALRRMRWPRLPPGPTLANPTLLAAKTTLAAATALALDHLTGNPDHVSATFVAVLCVSPTVLMGLRRAAAQLAGSAAGGLLGALALALQLPALLGVPLAVGGAVRLSFAMRLPMGYPVAAFTALFVQLVPREGPVHTFEVRLLAVLIASLSGFAVNVAVSSHAYEALFRRRLTVARRRVLAALSRAAMGGDDLVQPVFQMLAEANVEMDLAVEELGWRRAATRRQGVARIRTELMRLRHLLHVASEIGVRRLELGLPEASVAELARWLDHPAGDPPGVDEPLQPTRDRLVAGLLRLDVLPATPVPHP